MYIERDMNILDRHIRVKFMGYIWVKFLVYMLCIYAPLVDATKEFHKVDMLIYIPPVTNKNLSCFKSLLTLHLFYLKKLSISVGIKGYYVVV